MGPGMMGGYDDNGGWDAMMRSRDWSWMAGNWRNMTRQDWQRLQQQWVSTSTATAIHERWGPWAIAGIAVGAMLLIALAIVARVRRPFGPPPAATGS